jgi:hypothetical protein
MRERSSTSCVAMHYFMEFSTENIMIHRFIHTLDTIPKNWYLELEMRRETTRWEELVQRFKVMFTFEHESPSIDVVL